MPLLMSDDEYGSKLINSIKEQHNCIAYSISDNVSDSHGITAKISTDEQACLSLNITSPWGNTSVTTGLIGEFNGWNLLASITSLVLSGFKLEQVCEIVPELPAVPGRMEVFQKNDSPRVIVDYAHTPDALEKAVSSIARHTHGELVCVFGCGGDRDQGKRAEMGSVAAKYADRIILTNDNPRFENADTILADIGSGIPETMKLEVIADRRSAIEHAIDSSEANDTVLVAGKGHEETQQIADRFEPFSDRLCIINLLERVI